MDHFRKIGADRAVLTDNKEQNKLIVNSYYQELVVNNQYFPDDLPMMDVLDLYSESVVQLRTEIKGFNIKSHIESFKEFIDDNKSYLYQKYGVGYHEERYQLPSGSDTPLNVDRQLQTLYGDDIPEMFHKYVTDKSILNKTTRQ